MNPIDASIREEIQQLNKEPWSQSKPNKPYKLLKFVDTVSATSLGRHWGGGESASGGGSASRWCWADPLPPELEKRTVRILLECFLVLHKFSAAICLPLPWTFPLVTMITIFAICRCHHEWALHPLVASAATTQKYALAATVWTSFNSLQGLFGLLWDQASLMRNKDHDNGTVKCPKMKPVSSEFYVHKQSLNWRRKRKIKSRTKLDPKLQSFANMEICLTWWVNLSSVPNKLNKYQLLNL